MLHANIKAARPLPAPSGRFALSPCAVTPRLRPSVLLRPATGADLDALEMVEFRAFAHNRLTRRSFARFLSSAQAALIVADHNDKCVGYALVLFRSRSHIARLYSIAVDPLNARCGVGLKLLKAVEQAAIGRGSKVIRLEVREDNRPAINLYRTFGYRAFGHHSCYYEDGSDALRLEKELLKFCSRPESARPKGPDSPGYTAFRLKRE